MSKSSRRRRTNECIESQNRTRSKKAQIKRKYFYHTVYTLLKSKIFNLDEKEKKTDKSSVTSKYAILLTRRKQAATVVKKQLDLFQRTREKHNHRIMNVLEQHYCPLMFDRYHPKILDLVNCLPLN